MPGFPVQQLPVVLSMPPGWPDQEGDEGGEWEVKAQSDQEKSESRSARRVLPRSRPKRGKDQAGAEYQAAQEKHRLHHLAASPLGPLHRGRHIGGDRRSWRLFRGNPTYCGLRSYLRRHNGYCTTSDSRPASMCVWSLGHQAGRLIVMYSWLRPLTRRISVPVGVKPARS